MLLQTVLNDLRMVDQFVGSVYRDAASVRFVQEHTWNALDLHTLAADIAEDEKIRAMMVQARTNLLNRLRRESASQE